MNLQQMCAITSHHQIALLDIFMLHCVAPFSHKKSQQERLSKSLILTNIFRNSCRKDDDDERNLVCNDISIYTVSENLHNIIQVHMYIITQEKFPRYLHLGTRCHLLSWDLGIVFDYFLLLLVDQKKIIVSLRVRLRSKQYFAVLYQILHNCVFDHRQSHEKKSSYEKENENHLPNTSKITSISICIYTYASLMWTVVI